VISNFLPSERDAAASAFQYLVTRSGTKIAYPVLDLAGEAGLEEAQLTSVLAKLSRGEVRILRQVGPAPGQPAESRYERYEIFHDVLAPAILGWRTRYVQEQGRLAAEKRLVQERQRVWLLKLGLAGVVLLLVGMVVLAIYAFQQRNVAEEATHKAKQ